MLSGLPGLPLPQERPSPGKERDGREGPWRRFPKRFQVFVPPGEIPPAAFPLWSMAAATRLNRRRSWLQGVMRAWLPPFLKVPRNLPDLE